MLKKSQKKYFPTKYNKIGLDIDGVLANFTLAWHKQYPEINPTPNTWFFDNKIGERIIDMENKNILDDFYLNIEPYLKSHELPFKPHCYITARPVSNKISEEWLKKHNFPSNNVVSVGIRSSKIKTAKQLGVDIFIDDSYENFIELNGAGIKTYLYSQPWNLKFDVGSMRINTLNDILIG